MAKVTVTMAMLTVHLGEAEIGLQKKIVRPVAENAPSLPRRSEAENGRSREANWGEGNGSRRTGEALRDRKSG